MLNRALFLALILTVGAGLGFLFAVNRPICSEGSPLKYINKSIACGGKPIVSKAEYVVFSNMIRKYVDSKIKEGTLSRAGIYFRDLEGGPAVSVNGDEKFAPASLLKLPVAIAYYRAEEENKDKGDGASILDRHIAYKGELQFGAAGQFYKPKETLAPGKSYSIGDLIYRMLAYSDNGSYEGLISFLKKLYPDRNYLLETFSDLGVLDPRSGLEQTLSPRSLISNFRLLYNASYLSAENSDQLLNTLSESEFKQGIVAGLPKNVKAAHKFGERELEGQNWEIHDCGIVYFPENPYGLCIMVQGKEPDSLARFIADISRMFYEEFDSRKLK